MTLDERLSYDRYSRRNVSYMYIPFLLYNTVLLRSIITVLVLLRSLYRLYSLSVIYNIYLFIGVTRVSVSERVCVR